MNLPERAEMDLTTLMKVGAMLAKSGYFKDAKSEAQAVAKVLAGAELGLAPVAAMTGINIINEKVSLAANVQAALVRKSGRYDYKLKQLDETACVLDFYDAGKLAGESRFTVQDAAKAGLTGGNWSKYTRNMLFSRCMSNGVKWYCPDLTVFPLYTPDELGAEVDGETGEMVVTQPRARISDLYPEPLAITEAPPRPEPDDEPPTPPDQDAARRAFYGACDRRGLCVRNDVPETRARVNGALGLPPVEGVLPWVAAAHGWDVLRRHIEDATELPADVLDRYWAEAMATDPTTAPQPEAAADVTETWGKALEGAGEPAGSVSRRGAH